jgi:methylphosphotriester-DNA--protein-cysteine methyltransferase
VSDRPSFARTGGGNRIHLTTCQHARTAEHAVRWAWADTRGSGEIARAVTQHDLQPCRSCKPIAALARWEAAQRAAKRPTGIEPTALEILEFERANPGTSGRKQEQIRKQFGITPVRYLQLVIAAVATEEALLVDAQAAHQIQDRIRQGADDRAALLRRRDR